MIDVETVSKQVELLTRVVESQLQFQAQQQKLISLLLEQRDGVFAPQVASPAPLLDGGASLALVAPERSDTTDQVPQETLQFIPTADVVNVPLQDPEQEAEVPETRPLTPTEPHSEVRSLPPKTPYKKGSVTRTAHKRRRICSSDSDDFEAPPMVTTAPRMQRMESMESYNSDLTNYSFPSSSSSSLDSIDVGYVQKGSRGVNKMPVHIQESASSQGSSRAMRKKKKQQKKVNDL